MCAGEEGEEVKKREEEEEGKKEIAAGVKAADGKRFWPTLDSSAACAGMAALPGTVPRMMRPAPGQNYPRTGFPLEGKSAWARRASAPPPGARGPCRGSDVPGCWRRPRQREGRRCPSLLGTESGRWTPGSFGGRHSSVFARLSVTGGLPPQGGTPGRSRPRVNSKSWRISVRGHYFQNLSPRLLSQRSALAGYSAFYARF